MREGICGICPGQCHVALDIGDIVEVEGEVFTTKSGEIV